MHSFLPTIDEVGEEDDGDDVMACDNGCGMAMQVTLDLPEPMAGDMTPEPKNRQQETGGMECMARGRGDRKAWHGREQCL